MENLERLETWLRREGDMHAAQIKRFAERLLASPSAAADADSAIEWAGAAEVFSEALAAIEAGRGRGDDAEFTFTRVRAYASDRALQKAQSTSRSTSVSGMAYARAEMAAWARIATARSFGRPVVGLHWVEREEEAQRPQDARTAADQTQDDPQLWLDATDREDPSPFAREYVLRQQALIAGKQQALAAELWPVPPGVRIDSPDGPRVARVCPDRSQGPVTATPEPTDAGPE